MIKRSDGKIGYRELFALFLFSIGVKIADNTPVMLYQEVDNAAWIVALASGVLFIGPLAIVPRITRDHEEQGLIQIIFSLLGPTLGLIVGLSLFGIDLFATIVNSRSYVDSINTLFLPNTPATVLYISFIAVCASIAKRGLEGVARTASILTYVYAVSIILLLILSLGKYRADYLFPILGPGFEEIGKGTVTFTSLYGELITYAVMFHFVRSYSDLRRGVAASTVFGVLILAFFCAAYVMIHDYPAVSSILYPFSQLIRTVQISRFLSNFEATFILFWTIAGVMRISIYLLITSMTLAYTIRIKEFEPLIYPLATLTIILGFLPSNPSETLEWLRAELLYPSTWMVLFGLPILLLVAKRLRGGHQ